jgi:outer membrane protein assembly factor BamB
LFEVRNLQLKSPVNVPFAVFEDTIVFADADRQLHVLNAQSFQILGSLPLEGIVTSAVWMVNGIVYLETDRSQLHAFELTPEPKLLWSLPLDNSGLAGTPLAVGTDLVVTMQNGDVWRVDPKAGNVKEQHRVDATFVNSPLSFGSHILAPSLDGSLYPLESLLTGGQ